MTLGSLQCIIKGYNINKRHYEFCNSVHKLFKNKKKYLKVYLNIKYTMVYKICKYNGKIIKDTRMLNHLSQQELRSKYILAFCLGRVLTILYAYLPSLWLCIQFMLNVKVKNSSDHKLNYIVGQNVYESWQKYVCRFYLVSCYSQYMETYYKLHRTSDHMRSFPYLKKRCQFKCAENSFNIVAFLTKLLRISEKNWLESDLFRLAKF